MPSVSDITAVVLSGGGARAAYQIGALRGVARVLGRAVRSPFPVITGTSAGAINAAALAAHADRFRDGVARLMRLWRRMDVERVYKADLRAVSAHGMGWLAAVLIGGRGPRHAASMLDNSPLHRLLSASSIARESMRRCRTATCARSRSTRPATRQAMRSRSTKPCQRSRFGSAREDVANPQRSVLITCWRRPRYLSYSLLHVSEKIITPTDRCGRSRRSRRRCIWVRGASW